MFGFSNLPYNIKNFNNSMFETDAKGLAVFLFRPVGKEKGTKAFLKSFKQDGKYNMLNIYNEYRQ